MFGVVYNSIQKFTIILIMKSIIVISIMNKYLDISIYLDNLTPLVLELLLYVDKYSLGWLQIIFHNWI